MHGLRHQFTMLYPTSTRDSRALARALSAGEPFAILSFEQQFRPDLIQAIGCSRLAPSAPHEVDAQIAHFYKYIFADGGRLLARYRGTVPFAHWLFLVAVRFFQSEAEVHRRPSGLSQQIVAGAFPLHGEMSVNRDALVEKIRAKIRRLDGYAKLYLRLRYVERMSPSDCDRLLHCAAGWSSVNCEPVMNAVVAVEAGCDARFSTGSPLQSESLLRCIDLRLDRVGTHPSAENFVGFFGSTTMTEHQAAHIAGCDDCIDALCALWARLPASMIEAGIRAQYHSKHISMHPWMMRVGVFVGAIMVAWLGHLFTR